MQLRSRKTTENELTLGPITLNTDSHVVTKHQKEVALNHKEFELLALLMQNKGKVCSRTEIIESVWDIHFDYNTSVIDVFINALRKKLALTASENYIQTVRGVGYIAKE